MSDDLLCEVCQVPLSDHTVAMAEWCIANEPEELVTFDSVADAVAWLTDGNTNEERPPTEGGDPSPVDRMHATDPEPPIEQLGHGGRSQPSKFAPPIEGGGEWVCPPARTTGGQWIGGTGYGYAAPWWGGADTGTRGGHHPTEVVEP